MFSEYEAFHCPYRRARGNRRGFLARPETPGVLFENSIVCLVVFVCCLFFVALWYPRVGV
jgi:hypothetical protein